MRPVALTPTARRALEPVRATRDGEEDAGRVAGRRVLRIPLRGPDDPATRMARAPEEARPRLVQLEDAGLTGRAHRREERVDARDGLRVLRDGRARAGSPLRPRRKLLDASEVAAAARAEDAGARRLSAERAHALARHARIVSTWWST